MVGVPLAQLPLPAGFPVHLLHVRRYDMDLVPTPDLMLEFGDRVGVLMPPDRKEEIRRHFGDTVKARPNSATSRSASAWCSAFCSA